MTDISNLKPGDALTYEQAGEDMNVLIRAAQSVISMASLNQQLISDEDLEKLKKIVKRINPNG